MNIRNTLEKIGLVKLVLFVVLIIAMFLFLFKDQIKEHRVTKAKIEMFKRMTDSKPGDWDDEFKQIYDSLIIQKTDTLD